MRKEAVVQSPDVSSIYEIPLVFKSQILDEIILSHFNLISKPSDLSGWENNVVARLLNPKAVIKIAVVGKYIELQDAYKSIYESLCHAGIANSLKVEVKKVDSEDIEKYGARKLLNDCNGILIPGGFGSRGIEGKICAIRFAREEGIPFLGLCLGMQCAVIEFARHVAGMKNANSTEFNKKTKYPVISLLMEQRSVKDLGGSMRLGAYPCRLKKNSLAFRIYQNEIISERHRHRYEFNSRYKKALEKKGLVFSGVYAKKGLIEIIELPGHPFFIAVQFHPEFKSKPDNAHPLFREFIGASLKLKK